MKYSNKTAFEAAIFLLRLIEKNGFPARFVGGCVRDRLLGAEPKDYDIGTSLLPEKCLDLLKQNRIKAIPTGIDYGTITAVVFGYTMEITTLREDVKTDGRRAVVKFGDSFELDAARRDFTINSLSEDCEGRIYDYFEGIKHLQEKKLVFVGDPEKRIKEDYLRILRLFRFHARFGFSFDESLEGLIKRNKDGLKKISQERITGEIEEILSSPFTYRSLVSMMKTEILGLLFPFASEENFDALLTFSKVYNESEKNLLFLYRLSALIYFSLEGQLLSLEEIDALGKELKISNQMINKIELLLCGYEASKKGFKDQASLLLFVSRCERGDNQDFFRDVATPFWFHLVNQDKKKKVVKKNLEKNLLLYTKKKNLLEKPIPFTGKDLMKILSLKEGPILGKVMEEMKQLFLNETIVDRDEMEKFLKKTYLK